MSPSRSPTRVGIVGLGYIGTTIGEQFHQHTDAVVSALCDLEQTRRRELGHRFAVDENQQYADYETMLENASLDAVLVATPHALHYEQVVAALERGLDVYCDKPLATDLDHARDLVDRSASSEQTLMVGYQRHLQTAFQTARARFRETKPEWLTASITQDWIGFAAGTWRSDPALSGGGFLYDTGSHVLDAVLWTTGLEPESVRASMDFHSEGVDTRTHLDVRFHNGTTGTFSFFGDAPAVREHIHLWDDQGAVYLEGKQWRSRQVFEIDTDSTEHHPYIDPRHEQSRADAFLESIRERTAPPATARDALAVTALTEAAYESAQRETRITVEY